jgi:hypothetical protein
VRRANLTTWTAEPSGLTLCTLDPQHDRITVHPLAVDEADGLQLIEALTEAWRMLSSRAAPARPPDA